MHTLPEEPLPQRISSTVLGMVLYLAPWWGLGILCMARFGPAEPWYAVLLHGIILGSVIGGLINLFIITPLILRFG